MRTERGSQPLTTPCCSAYSVISPWVVPGVPIQCGGRWGAVISGIQMPLWEMQPTHCSLSQDQDCHTGGEKSTSFCFQCKFQAAQETHRGLMNTADKICRRQLYIFLHLFVVLLFSSPLSFHSFPSVSVFHFIVSLK